MTRAAEISGGGRSGGGFGAQRCPALGAVADAVEMGSWLAAAVADGVEQDYGERPGLDEKAIGRGEIRRPGRRYREGFRAVQGVATDRNRVPSAVGHCKVSVVGWLGVTDAVQVVCDDEVLTYGEAERRPAELARALLGAGVGGGTRVAILHPNGASGRPMADDGGP